LGISGENRTGSETISGINEPYKLNNPIQHLMEYSVFGDLFSKPEIYLLFANRNQVKICNFTAGISINPGR